jgi:ABC-type glycerol-3-phosphate transport system permease component
MARRAALTLLVFLELTAAAAVAVALRYGRFDQGVGFYLYLIGPLAAIALATGFALSPEILRRASTHGLLLLGCVVFSLPFVWLVSTSFKYEEEIFVHPPQWVPSTPRVVARSPYIAAERAGVERPAAITPQRWETLAPKIAQALRERGVALLGEQRDALAVRGPATLDAVAASLFARAASGLPDAAWQADDAAVIAAVTKRVAEDDAETVWDSLRRAVQLGEITLADDDGIEHRVSAAGSSWQTVEGDVRVVTASPPTVVYDLTNSPRATIAMTLDLPFDPARLLSIRLPMRQDRSWNRLGVRLDTPAGPYIAEDSMSLGQRRWQELSFRMKHKDARDERDVGVWPLVPAAAVAPADATDDMPSGRMRVMLTIERASAVEAAGRKYANNYLQAYFASGQRWRYVRNSLYLVALTVLGQVLSCSMVAYAFARIRWPGRDVLFVVLLATMMLPPQVTMVPTFVIYKHLGWYNTLKALWIPSFFGSAFFIFMLRQFMRSIPRELEEAARIDGCGYFGIYWRIILPVMKPALAAVGIFTFMGTWNDFMGPLIYINDERLYPLSLGLFDFRMQHGAAYGMLMAASTLMTLPVIAIFFVAQRYFIQGISLTGMKA